VLLGWLWHLPAAALPLWWTLQVSALPLWAYLVAVYLGMSVLKIRTYLEHRAHELSRGRTVIIEDRGILALLFLNNNFHAVHHSHPQISWFDLPGFYAAKRARFVQMNEGYVYRSYAEIFRAYFWRAKDPVPHPLWSPKDN
jgi:fatty acid desaturase